MRQYILPLSFNGEPSLTLYGKESKYLVKVLRLGVGERLLGRDRTGNAYLLTITKTTSSSCTLSCEIPETEITVDEAQPAYTGPWPQLTLVQALLKGRKEDELIRQATEIGVKTITLVKCRNCVTDGTGCTTQRMERLQNKVREALQQSGSTIPTVIQTSVLNLTDLPAWWGDRGLALFLHHVDDERSQTLPPILADHPIDRPIALLVGPEGGFTDEESLFLQAHGFIPILLRSNILRSQTAALYALSAIQVLLTEAGN